MDDASDPNRVPPVPATPPLPTPVRRASSRAWRWLGGSAVTVVMLVLLAAGVVVWTLHSAAGTGWLLTLVPQLKVTGPRGSLLGDFAADRIDITLPGTSGALRLDAPRWHALAATRGDHGRWLRLTIDTLHADRITLLPGDTKATTTSAPTTPPRTLRLPIELEIREASVDELRFGAADDAARLRTLRGRVHLGDNGGATHRFESLEARYEEAHASGQATISADAPFAVASRVVLAYDKAAPAWQASAEAVGPLDTLRVDATIRAGAVVAAAAATSGTVGAPSLDARAVVKPFATWPLGELHATTTALDLKAFWAGAPATSLSGEANVVTSGIDRPASVAIDLRNARAGRWNEGLLPVRSARADVRAKPDAPNVLDVQTLTGELGSMQAAAGRLSARGRWSPDAWNLDAVLEKVRPSALDARAPETSLDGKVTASSATDKPVAVAADLAGMLVDRRLAHGAPRTARLRFDASIGERAIELRSSEARAGDASATLTGRMTRSAVGSPWQAAGRVALTQFDPTLWWSGSTDSVLSRGVNRLNAKGEFDLALPRTFASSAYDILVATRGKAALSVTDSALAGIPLQAEASFSNADGNARPSLDLVAGGNSVKARGHIGASAVADGWTLDIDAPQLARLAALVRAPGAAASGAAAGGTLTAKATIGGRWPTVTSSGEVHGAMLRFDTLAVRKAEGQWSLGSAADAPLNGSLVLDGIDAAGRVVERARAQATGTARAHHIELDVASDALPPEWTDALVAGRAVAGPVPAGAAATASLSPSLSPSVPPAVATPTAAAPIGRSAVVLRADGGLVDVGTDRAAGWTGTVRELVAQSTATPSRTWLRARDVRGSVQWGGGPLRTSVEPGSAELLGASVHWNRIAWQAGVPGAAAQLDAQATVDPMPAAPILRALQPEFGWGGDLTVGARLNVRSTPSVVVDVVVERASGDLSVTDEISTQLLGFSDLRFGIAASDGIWNFTAALAGSTLGVASGSITARTDRTATWPGPDTPLQGVVELRVASLGTWGPWVPVGWRLGGELHASASIGGRFGRPEYTGTIRGTDIGVRNFLQGVNVVDGDIAIALQGSTARIEHATARGGTGRLSLEGDASFEAVPVANLRLVADKFELLGRVDRSIVTSGSASMRLDARTIALDGTFKVDEGLIDFTRSDAPSLGSDVEVVRRPAAPASSAAVVTLRGAAYGNAAQGSAAPPTAAAAAASAPVLPTSRKIALDLRVGMGEKLRIRGRGIDAGLRGDLHLTSPDGRLTVDGTLRAVDGTYQAYGQKLGIDRGVITFVGPIENPRLDIEATRPNLDVRVGVIVAGTALNPRIRLFSEPDMSDIDRLSWLILGRASEGVGASDTALLQSAALALLSGEGPGVTDRLTQAIGLDSFGVRQESVGEVRSTIVTLGKQLSKRWYVGYERGLNATAGSWQLIYRVAQRITLRAQAGEDNSVDLIWTVRWK